MKLHYLLFLLSFSLALSSCNKETAEQPLLPHLNLTYTAAPIPLNGIDAKFAGNVSYNGNANSTFDIFMPAGSKPSALIIFLHGGAFTGGDKSVAYDSDGGDNIRYYLQNNIAFVTANYQLMQDDPSQGLYTSFKDIQRCLQFIRYYAASFNIDKNKIAAYGGSAGGGASIWLGFHPDMADANASDPLKRESTRLQAVGHTTSQASYDPLQVQAMFTTIGVDYLSVPGVTDQVNEAYVITNSSQLTTDKRVVAMRADVDMLGLMTADDPALYTQNSNPVQTPDNVGIANHIPLHSKTLYEKALLVGVACEANIPAYSIDNTNGETLPVFLVRKLME